MISPSFKTAIVLLFSTTTFLVSCKDKSVDLRFMPANGSVYELDIEKRANAATGDKKQEHAQGATWVLRTSGDSSKIDINATYKRFWINYRSPEDSLQVDTDRATDTSRDSLQPNFMVDAIWRQVKGEAFDIHMNTLGGIDSFGSFSPLIAAVTKKFLGDSTPMSTDKLARVWDIAAAQFAATAISDQLSPVLLKYPGTHLKAGDTLTHMYKEASGLGLVMVQMLKIAEMNDTQVIFIMGGHNFNEADAGGKLKAEQQGKIIVNRQTGMLESAYIEEVVEGMVDNKPLKVNSIIKATCRKVS